jgi:hypothetical protein
VIHQKRGVYAESWLDWLTHRRSFTIETEVKPEIIRQEMVEIGTPPPADGNPLSVRLLVALSSQADSPTVFEINLARGLPIREGHYIPFQAVGRIDNVDVDGKYLVKGEIRPLRQGVVVYTAVLVVLLLWIAAAVTSAAISDLTSYASVWVALGTTLILSFYMLLLQWRDMRRLAKLLLSIKDIA